MNQVMLDRSLPTKLSLINRAFCDFMCLWRLAVHLERVLFKADQCLGSSWWWFPTEKQIQNQSHDSHLGIFDWNSKKWLDGGTAGSLVISRCVKASEQSPFTKPDLLPNVSRNEAALHWGASGSEDKVTIFNSPKGFHRLKFRKLNDWSPTKCRNTATC